MRTLRLHINHLGCYLNIHRLETLIYASIERPSIQQRIIKLKDLETRKGA